MSIAIQPIQVNLDMTDSMGPGKLVRHMQNLSHTYDEYISSVICKNLSDSGPSYPSSPVLTFHIKYIIYDKWTLHKAISEMFCVSHPWS